jgi:ubiquinone biosynthesis protein UbiJ
MTSPDTLAQVEHVCAQLHQEGQPVTFTAVATRARISRTSLYRNDTLRAVIEEHRGRSHDPRSLSGVLAEIAHLRDAVEALAERVRRHEEQLRRLNRTHKAD